MSNFLDDKWHNILCERNTLIFIINCHEPKPMKKSKKDILNVFL
jgi:hypothetical protein